MDDVGCVGNKILTRSGAYFDFANPDSATIILTDIAFSLSRLTRYNGHCEFYSVAEHCVHCSNLLGLGNAAGLEALMHDASEAYTGDVAKPLKIMLPDFQKIEEATQSLINAKWGITGAFHGSVKRIDHMMLKAEKRQLFPGNQDEWGALEGVLDPNITIERWPPKVAYLKFLGRFKDLRQS